jgi:hypothetical protein
VGRGVEVVVDRVLGAVVNLEVKSCEGWEILDGLADAALCGDRDWCSDVQVVCCLPWWMLRGVKGFSVFIFKLWGSLGVVKFFLCRVCSVCPFSDASPMALVKWTCRLSTRVE